MKIPSLKEIDLPFLNQVFIENDITSPNNPITDFTLAPINDGKGWISSLFMLGLKYKKNDNPQEELPKKMVLKLATENQDLLDTVKMHQTYKKEVDFYNNIARKIPISTLKCYLASIDLKSGKQFILLEFCNSGVNLSKGNDCTLEHAKAVMDTMADFHSVYWNRIDEPELASIPSYEDIMHYNTAGIEVLTPQFQQMWERFLKYPGIELPDEIRTGFPQAIPQFLKLMNHLFDNGPRTLVHGDFHLDNLFLREKPKGYDVLVFDWQLIEIGRGALDLSFFINECLTIENRQKFEDTLIERYYKRLISNGVKDYSMKDLMADYELALFYRFTHIVYDVVNIPFEKEDLATEAKLLLPRSSAACQDHHVLDQVLGL